MHEEFRRGEDQEGGGTRVGGGGTRRLEGTRGGGGATSRLQEHYTNKNILAMGLYIYMPI